MTSSSWETRRLSLSHLGAAPLDLLVVGGGIVGAGVARDAAMRGLRVGLVEQHDFAYGTSSRSSRLLHGGLRYLAQGEIGLVREASKEKRTLAELAPHLARPLGFIFPAYRGEGPPLWQLRIGVKLYDLLCSGRNFAPSRAFGLSETTEMLPNLRRDNLRGTVRYYDALTNDARLVFDTLRSAEREGAMVLNYLQLSSAKRNGAYWECSLSDRLDGTAYTVRASTVINATGPWADKMPHSNVRLRLTKGIHIVVDASRLKVPSAVVITEGKRILFVLPWGDRVILGTTDTDFSGPPEAVSVEADDVAYVLRSVNHFFPRADLRPADVISSWVGLRPLVANADGSPSDISRAHEIKSSQPGWWDITGGKLTTYRLMSEQAVDKIVAHLGVSASACRTATQPLLTESEQTPYSSIEPPPCTLAAVQHYVRHEWAQHLADVMVRRSGWHYWYRVADRPAAQVADWMAQLCGWDETKKLDELRAYEEEVALSEVSPALVKST